MDKTKLDETCIFKISIKIRFFFMQPLVSNFRFLEFRLLLSRFAPFYTVRFLELFDFTKDIRVDGGIYYCSCG